MNKPFFITGLLVFAAAAIIPAWLYSSYPPCYTSIGLEALEQPPAMIGAVLVFMAACLVAWSFALEDIEP